MDVRFSGSFSVLRVKQHTFCRVLTFCVTSWTWGEFVLGLRFFCYSTWSGTEDLVKTLWRLCAAVAPEIKQLLVTHRCQTQFYVFTVTDVNNRALLWLDTMSRWPVRPDRSFRFYSEEPVFGKRLPGVSCYSCGIGTCGCGCLSREKAESVWFQTYPDHITLESSDSTWTGTST